MNTIPGLSSLQSNYIYNEYCRLLVNLKNTTEILLSTETKTVWDTFGGIDRISNPLLEILYHGLISDLFKDKNVTFWRYLCCLNEIKPDLSVNNKELPKDGIETWLHYSLNRHLLSIQLLALVNSEYTKQFYNEYAFIRNHEYFNGLLKCLSAIENNNNSLLADIDVSLIHLNDTVTIHESKADSAISMSSVISNYNSGIDIDVKSSRNSLSTAKYLPTPFYFTGHKRSKSDIIFNSTNVDKKRQTFKEVRTSCSSLEKNINVYDKSVNKAPNLIDYLKVQDTFAGTDLDRENAHFLVCDMVITAMSLINWKHNVKKKIIEIRNSCSTIEKNNDNVDDNIEKILKSCLNSDLTVSSENRNTKNSLFCDNDSDDQSVSTMNSIELNNNFDDLSAENIAINFLKKFKDSDLPKASDLDWLVSDNDTPQTLLPLPRSKAVFEEDAQTRRSRIRGTEDWAPPRSQLIYDEFNPPRNKRQQMILQKWKCSGCGAQVNESYIKRMRFCYYFGKLFCPCCHECFTNYIPSKILKKWDFRRYPLSNFANELIKKHWNDIDTWEFDVNVWNSHMYKKIRKMKEMLKIRTSLRNTHEFILTCRIAEKEGLVTYLKNFQSHWYKFESIYTLDNLVAVYFNKIQQPLYELQQKCIQHIRNCELCCHKGFICEFCKNDDIIFPFETKKVIVCKKCRTSFHKKCYIPNNCPKCLRIKRKKQCSNNIDLASK